MRLWLDDVRPAPEGWEWARDAETAVAKLEVALRDGEPLEAVSLDHDLGADPGQGVYARGNSEICGCYVVDYLIQVQPPIEEPIRIHSWNPSEARKMATALNYAGYDVDLRPYRIGE